MAAVSAKNGGIPSLRDALRRAQALGGQVCLPRGTGEVKVRFPGLGTVTHNNRRKDASRALCVLLRRAEGETAGTRCGG
jgi:hypothetical protein